MGLKAALPAIALAGHGFVLGLLVAACQDTVSSEAPSAPDAPACDCVLCENQEDLEATAALERRYCDDAGELMHRRTFMTADGRCYSAMWNRPDLGWSPVALPYFPELEGDK
jgi:hypothetical protein